VLFVSSFAVFVVNHAKNPATYSAISRTLNREAKFNSIKIAPLSELLSTI
jgi:hypothetical protein